jgi:hypothetical protein
MAANKSSKYRLVNHNGTTLAEGNNKGALEKEGRLYTRETGNPAAVINTSAS